MAVVNCIVLTEAELLAAQAHGTPELGLGRKPINGTSPGVGINLNDLAAVYAPGDIVTLTGKFTVPKTLIDNAEYNTEVPLMVAALADKPYCLLESESIFAPEEA